MRFFLFILFFTFFAPLQSSKTKFFFVTRRDNKEAICIWPRISSIDTFPTFDLDKLQIPLDVGFKNMNWLTEWQLQNDTDVRRIGEYQMFIAANQPFHFVTPHHYGYPRVTNVNVLASNISLWMAEENRHRCAGLLIELDHLNETTNLKDTTLKYCDQNPEVEGANCTIVNYKNGTNHLKDGNHWTLFRIHFREMPTGVEMNEYSYRKEKPSVVQWTWNITNISNLFKTGEIYYFAKSHQRNAALRTYGDYPDLANTKEMKRNYTKRSSGRLCVCVKWNDEKSNDSNELMQVKNLASGRVQLATKITHIEDLTKFRWKNLAAGEYEITLRFDKRQPYYGIDLCPESGSMIRRTWDSIPKAITKCQFQVGELYNEFSAGPSSPPDPKLKPAWTLKEWAYVCDRLGIGSKDAEVQIKFCNFYGCNFSKCPHLQHEPPHIFDF